MISGMILKDLVIFHKIQVLTIERLMRLIPNFKSNQINQDQTNEDGAADEHEYYDENKVKNGDNIDDNGGEKYNEVEIDEFIWLKDSKSNCSENSLGFNKGSYGVGLSNAYEILNSKTEPKQSLWPSEIYKKFMIAVTQYHLSDAAADSMLRII
ncbi:hypothetical protein RhiirC2_720932 [Rhizophagus irregularis]|uniref:Uncharacterized protein n=1 Tax=Rhizophagus irregularis TaxID=588596 RepID=A0A2N1M8D6_9GLOM|nr:hypothetical protein RhiirC2_720932 [Rhizophagus irregularis]